MESKPLSPRRKVAHAGFDDADRFSHVSSSVRARNLLNELGEVQQDHPDVTVEHFFIKALALAIKGLRYGNGRVRAGRFCEFDTVDISNVVTREGGICPW